MASGKAKGRSRVTKAAMKKAIKDSGGIMTRVAERLGVHRTTVRHLLLKDSWAEERALFEEERDAVCDTAEQTIQDLIVQRIDLSQAGVTARWLLERLGKERGFGTTEEIRIGGNGTPVKVDMVELSALPLTLRKQILRHLKKDE